MRSPKPIEQLQRRLVELGCPPKAARNILRETAEHYEDLQRAALAQGLPPDEASSRAAEQLGDSAVLAERHVEVLRKSSWWGRFPRFAFGVLPLLVMLELTLQYYSLNGGQLPAQLDRLPISQPKLVEWAYPAFFVAVIAVTAALTFFFCRMAARCAVGHRWMWMTGGVLAVNGLFMQIHSSIGMGLSLIQPIELADQKVAPGHPMDISIGGSWTKPDRLKLYHDEHDMDSDYRFDAMPETIYEYYDKRDLPTNRNFKPYDAPDVEEKINQGVAELRQRSLRGQLPSHTLRDPGWTASGISTSWQHTWTNRPNGISADLEIERDDAGNLNWTLCSGEMLPWPVLSYGLPGLGYGQTYQAINVATPLLIVAAMLAWQSWRGKRLLREGVLGPAQSAGCILILR